MCYKQVFLTMFLLATVAAVQAAYEAPRLRLPRLYADSPVTGMGGRVRNHTNADGNLNYRLPNNTEPIHYDIELVTNVHTGNRSFTGKVQILFIIKEDTQAIVLHARQLKEYEATIRNADSTNSSDEPLNVTYEETREFLTLTLTNTSSYLVKYSLHTLTITYKGELRTDGAGFHIISYTNGMNQLRYLATTQFGQTDARHAFPCYDEPAKRATFAITIKHSPSYSALSNMPMNKTASRPDVTVFKKTNFTIPTYLIAFHVSDYQFSEDKRNEVVHRVYSKPGTVGDQEFGLQYGMQILQHLGDYYQVAFPLPRMIQVAIPGKDGAMENWGLITYNEDSLLFNNKTSTTDQKMSTAILIAHEFCHQWFGNLVTLKWWTYLWLKEGFATLCSYQVTDKLYPYWDVYQQLFIYEYQFALTMDGAGHSGPMTQYVQTPAEISSHSGISSYEKAASVLSMWQNALGDKAFRSGVNIYLTKYAFSATDEWQFFDALQSAVDEENVTIPARIDVMFPTWSHQAGFPLLTVKRNYNANLFTVTQQAFHKKSNVTSGTTFYVPLNYAYQAKPDFQSSTASHYLFSTKETTIIDQDIGIDDWLILNKQSTGYYRINYDERNWNLITGGLIQQPNMIHPLNRAQLLDDASALVGKGYLSQDILLNLLTYLSGEVQYAPWATAEKIFGTYKLFLRDDVDYGYFKKFIASLVTNIYKQIGINDKPGEQLLRKFTRRIIIKLACEAGVNSCLVDSSNKLKEVINNGISVEPNLESHVYCNGLRRSSDTEYKYFFNQLLSTNNTSYRKTLITSLGCSENEEQLQMFVNSLIDGDNNFTTAERTTILKATYTRSGLGLMVTIKFLNDNWRTYADISNHTGSANPLNNDIIFMCTCVMNYSQKEMLLDLVGKVKGSSKVESDLEGIVQMCMQVKFDWLEMNREPVMTWMQNYNNHRVIS